MTLSLALLRSKLHISDPTCLQSGYLKTLKLSRLARSNKAQTTWLRVWAVLASSSATSAGPSKGVSNVKDSEAKPQTVPDGWNVPASTSTTTPAATPATTSVEPVATSGQSAQELSAPASAPTADDDALASAEKEAEEMSHEDGECLTAFICSINAVCMEARLSVGQISCYLELIAPTLSIR
jgi:hypothetical protein